MTSTGELHALYRILSTWGGVDAIPNVDKGELWTNASNSLMLTYDFVVSMEDLL